MALAPDETMNQPDFAQGSMQPDDAVQGMAEPNPNDVVDQMQAAGFGETDNPAQEGREDGDDPKGPISGIEQQKLMNYAADEMIAGMFRADVIPNIKTARDNREAKVEQDWIRYRDIYNLRRMTAYYEGRSKLFIPAIKKAIDTLVRMAKDAIFSDPYLGIETDIPKYKDAAMDLMTWLLEDQARIKEKMPMFLRQLYQIGTSCFKVTWRKQKRQVKYREFNQELQTVEIKTRNEYDYYGPKVDVIDMRHVYVWPETCVDYDTLKLVFEDSTITREELERLVEEGIYDAIAVATALSRPSATLETQRLSEGQASREGLADVTQLPKGVLDITYIWAKVKLPGQPGPQWNQAVMLNDNPQDLVLIGENPFWFQKPNYLFGSLFQEHDYFYGHGIVEMLEMWQYMVNDVANQTMDTGTFTLNPITAYDPGSIDDPDMLEVQPMGKWPINPKNVTIIRPPIELAQQGIGMLQFLMNIIQESSDATALAQGAPRTGLGRATGTATGVSQLFAASNAAIMDQVETLQAQVLTPLAHYIEIMTHEFMDEEMIIRRVGQEGTALTQRIIRPQDLMLSTDVRWIASNRLREKSAKIQQLINFFNIAVQIPPQLTMQQGFQIGFKEIIKDIYSGLGLANTDRVIIDMMNALPGIPPEFEQELMDAGRAVIASPMDTPANHQAHLMAHMQHYPASELARVRLMEHVASHYQAMQQAAMMQQQMANGGQAPAQPGGGQQGMPGGQPGQQGPVQAGARPQEQPQGNPADALKGLLSQLGGENG